MNSRLVILPDARFAELHSALEERLDAVGNGISPGAFAALLDPLMRQVLKTAFAEAQADEGTIWMHDRQRNRLVPAFNSGPNAETFTAQISLSPGEGLVSLVWASEQPLVENDVAGHPQHSAAADQLLQVETRAMIAVPFHFLRACRGVISCVQLGSGNPTDAGPSGFDARHLYAVQHGATLLSRLIEYHLLSRIVGWGLE